MDETTNARNDTLVSSENGIFQKRLNQLIKDSGKSQRELSDFVDVTKQSVSLYSSGKRTPDINTLYKMCKYFGVSADYLLGLSDVKSLELDIKTISEKTGLSEESILILECIRNDGKKRNLMMVINFLLEQESATLIKSDDSYLTTDQVKEKIASDGSEWALNYIDTFLNTPEQNKDLHTPLISIIAKYFNVKFNNNLAFEIDGNIFEDGKIIDDDTNITHPTIAKLHAIDINANELMDYIYLTKIDDCVKSLKESYINRVDTSSEV